MPGKYFRNLDFLPAWPTPLHARDFIAALISSYRPFGLSELNGAPAWDRARASAEADGAPKLRGPHRPYLACTQGLSLALICSRRGACSTSARIAKVGCQFQRPLRRQAPDALRTHRKRTAPASRTYPNRGSVVFLASLISNSFAKIMGADAPLVAESLSNLVKKCFPRPCSDFETIARTRSTYAIAF